MGRWSDDRAPGVNLWRPGRDGSPVFKGHDGVVDGVRGRQIIIPKRSVAFFTIPKCASNAISLAFMPECKQFRVDLSLKPFLWDHWGDFRRYAVLRCPVQRFQSAYTFLTSRGLDERSVDEAVKHVVSSPDDKIDMHYRSQASYLTLDGVVLPNRLIVFEDLPRRFPKLFVGLSLPHTNKRAARPPKLSKAQQQDLLNRFSADVLLLQQAQTSPEALKW